MSSNEWLFPCRAHWLVMFPDDWCQVRSHELMKSVETWQWESFHTQSDGQAKCRKRRPDTHDVRFRPGMEQQSVGVNRPAVSEECVGKWLHEANKYLYTIQFVLMDVYVQVVRRQGSRRFSQKASSCCEIFTFTCSDFVCSISFQPSGCVWILLSCRLIVFFSGDEQVLWDFLIHTQWLRYLDFIRTFIITKEQTYHKSNYPIEVILSIRICFNFVISKCKPHLQTSSSLMSKRNIRAISRFKTFCSLEFIPTSWSQKRKRNDRAMSQIKTLCRFAFTPTLWSQKSKHDNRAMSDIKWSQEDDSLQKWLHLFEFVSAKTEQNSAFQIFFALTCIILVI